MPRKTSSTARPARGKKAVSSASVPKRHRKAVPAPSSEVSGEVSREDIARLAFSYWQQRGCTGGSPEDDWLRAERELTLNR